ncbi:hypothetical protein B0H66DRAFT_600229 [Apodospora peruviana]|uniref:Uncharacterized protein n=1 Tax=Apodospora peruviana TaxID=516989 RepID=A0AAE0IJK3_9PEZI|nr:hypothetical protein B0H66DRAFT_600229 [Apodospora peruviana]
MISLRHCLLLLLGAPVHGLAASVPLPPAGSQVIGNRDGVGDNTNTALLSSRDPQSSTVLQPTDLMQDLGRRSKLDIVKFLGSYAKTNAGKENDVGVAATFIAIRLIVWSWISVSTQCVSASEEKNGDDKKRSTATCVLDAISLALSIALLGWQSFPSFNSVNNMIAAYKQQTTRPPKRAASLGHINATTLYVRDVVLPTLSKALAGSGVEIRHLGVWNDTTVDSPAAVGKRNDQSLDARDWMRPVFGARSSDGTEFHFAFLESQTPFLNGHGIDIKMKMISEPEDPYKKVVSVDKAHKTISQQLDCLWEDQFSWHGKETNALHLEIWDLVGRFSQHGGTAVAVWS